MSTWATHANTNSLSNFKVGPSQQQKRAAISEISSETASHEDKTPETLHVRGDDDLEIDIDNKGLSSPAETIVDDACERMSKSPVAIEKSKNAGIGSRMFSSWKKTSSYSSCKTHAGKQTEEKNDGGISKADAEKLEKELKVEAIKDSIGKIMLDEDDLGI